MTTFLANRDIYSSVVCGIVPQGEGAAVDATTDVEDIEAIFDQHGRRLIM